MFEKDEATLTSMGAQITTKEIMQQPEGISFTEDDGKTWTACSEDGSVIAKDQTVEVVRMEFTPDKVLVIDRFNKQYVEASYSDAAFLRSASLDFYTLQALFWDELFYPGKRNVKEALSEYAISSSGEHTLLSLTSAPKLNYDFLTLTASHLIDRVSVTPKNTQATESLVCKYGDFASFSGKKFPTSISIVAKGGKRDVNLGITLSRLSDDSKWETRTTVPSNYKKRNIEDVLSQLSRIQ